MSVFATACFRDMGRSLYSTCLCNVVAASLECVNALSQNSLYEAIMFFMAETVYPCEKPPGRAAAFFLKGISIFIDRTVVGMENRTKGRKRHFSEKMDLSEYNYPEYFEHPELFYNGGTGVPDVTEEFGHAFAGVKVSCFSYDSEVESAYPENNVVRGRMFESTAEGSGSNPCVIVAHGWREEGCFTFYYYLLGLLLARAGINCLFITQPYHGPRKPAGSAHGDLMLSADMERTINAFRQSISDIRALISWGRARYTGPVGMMGLSLGGFITLLTACVDDRIDFAIPIIASGNIIEGMWNSIAGRTIVRDFDRMGIAPETVEKNWRIISPVYFRPKLPPDRIQLIPARYDMLIPAENVARLWEAWNHPECEWLYSGHVSIFLFPRKLVGTIVNFIGHIVRRDSSL